jgi:hypothetical protein
MASLVGGPCLKKIERKNFSRVISIASLIKKAMGIQTSITSFKFGLWYSSAFIIIVRVQLIQLPRGLVTKNFEPEFSKC